MRILFNLSEGPTDGLDDTTTTAETKYFVILVSQARQFV